MVKQYPSPNCFAIRRSLKGRVVSLCYAAAPRNGRIFASPGDRRSPFSSTAA
jgi:hypothetical protein